MSGDRLQCPECSGMLVLRQSRFGKFYGCENWPGCAGSHSAHQETGLPMGVPADRVTKDARREAHEAFDDIWKTADAAYDLSDTPPHKRAKAERHIQHRMRTRCYHWLAHELKMPVEECHIGAFDFATCQAVTGMCRFVSPQDVRQWAKERGL